ncbi:translation initiation factor IF-2-like [Meles meles]|uniref:translation initiation factor IF-2-like n=1 Tax=Meles meles TaxID=9662 RepID=UPI001E69C837|nr:translation initiation factor IF-2-like [Meles meles]
MRLDWSQPPQDDLQPPGPSRSPQASLSPSQPAARSPQPASPAAPSLQPPGAPTCPASRSGESQPADCAPSARRCVLLWERVLVQARRREFREEGSSLCPAPGSPGKNWGSSDFMNELAGADGSGLRDPPLGVFAPTSERRSMPRCTLPGCAALSLRSSEGGSLVVTESQAARVRSLRPARKQTLTGQQAEGASMRRGLAPSRELSSQGLAPPRPWSPGSLRTRWGRSSPALTPCPTATHSRSHNPARGPARSPAPEPRGPARSPAPEPRGPAPRGASELRRPQPRRAALSGGGQDTPEGRQQ